MGRSQQCQQDHPYPTFTLRGRPWDNGFQLCTRRRSPASVISFRGQGRGRTWGTCYGGSQQLLLGVCCGACCCCDGRGCIGGAGGGGIVMHDEYWLFPGASLVWTCFSECCFRAIDYRWWRLSVTVLCSISFLSIVLMFWCSSLVAVLNSIKCYSVSSLFSWCLLISAADCSGCFVLVKWLFLLITDTWCCWRLFTILNHDGSC